MPRLLTIMLLVVLPLSGVARADETVRQVQEELRKRNLYFGNIDGQSSPVLVDALKRYQARKGFAVTGKVDRDTATSLHLETATVATSLPDVPVLKSDTASALPESQRLALQREAEEKPDLTPSPPPPAESPPPEQDLNRERVNKFVQDYLRDAESAGANPNNRAAPVAISVAKPNTHALISTSSGRCRSPGLSASIA